MRNKLKDSYKKIDEICDQDEEESREIEEEILTIQRQIANETEILDISKTEQIKNFEINSKGKNTAASYRPAKDMKRKKQIDKIIRDGEEIQKREEIVKVMQERFKNIVGREHVQTMTLEEFMRKYNIQLDKIEIDKEGYELEFTFEEIRKVLADAKGDLAPGPTAQTHAFFKFIFSEISYIMTQAINELTFVLGFAGLQLFKWQFYHKIIYIPKSGKDDRYCILRI